MDRAQVKDTLGRAMKDLRISVTDRCNFRCSYCMPLEKYEWIDRSEILTFEEVARLSRLFIRLGVEEIRITGGEPLLRHGLEFLVSQLAGLEGLKDLSLTTNASMLSEKAVRIGSGRVEAHQCEPRHHQSRKIQADDPAGRSGQCSGRALGSATTRDESDQD